MDKSKKKYTVKKEEAPPKQVKEDKNTMNLTVKKWLIYVSVALGAVIITWINSTFYVDAGKTRVYVMFFNQPSLIWSSDYSLVDKNGNVVPVQAKKISVVGGIQ